MTDETTVGGAIIRKRKLTDYDQNRRNHNKGTERGGALLEQSFERYGAGRSLLADAEGRLIAGNHAQQAAVDAGLTDVIEVETSGNELVVVRRRDLNLDTDTRAVEMGYLDNMAQVRDFDLDALQVLADLESGADLSLMFRDDELDLLEMQADIETMIDSALAGEGAGGKRIPGDKAQVKVVLYAPQIATIERALMATGIVNRGEALVEICQAYLKAADDAG